uniref:Organic solute transporter alpha-like protein n=1 Tax=Ascaris lumbricoides TaxID=6252 RepID=A0A9J2PKL9_ASCLU
MKFAVAMTESSFTEMTVDRPKELFDISYMPPTGAVWLQEANAFYLTAIILATIATFAVVIMSVCSLLAMYMPRCSVLMFTICLTYLMVCLIMVFNLLRNLFGSKEALSDYLEGQNRKILLSVPPLCCCCKCCPPVSPTPLNLRHLEWMIVQSPIARITIEVIFVMAFLEQTGYDKIVIIGQILEAASMLTASWACQMIIIVSQDKLQSYCFGTIFKFVNTSQVFVTLQKLIFDLIGKYHGFDSVSALGPIMKALCKSSVWNNFTLTLEMCLMAALATYLVSPERSALFDLYGRRKHHPETPPLDSQKEDVLQRSRVRQCTVQQGEEPEVTGEGGDPENCTVDNCVE